MSEAQYHIDCRAGDVARYVLLPGDPGRAEQIAASFDAAERVAAKREFTTYTGVAGGVRLSVTSTGIGGPSAAIAVEELTRVGADTFVRVGTAGGMQPAVGVGDLVVATATIRDEGTTRQYLPVEFPAVAAPAVAAALTDAAATTGRRHHAGVVHSKDSFYGQLEPESMPVAARLAERWQAWRAAGALCSEMEAAAVFVVATVRRARAGAVLVTVGNQTLGARPGDEAARGEAMDDAIRCARDAMVALAAADGSDGTPLPDARRGPPPA